MNCRCGHAHAFHQHHRRGSDCSACDCPRYRWSLLRALWDIGTGRGEVAEHPDVIEERLTVCPINATPHLCDGEYAISGPLSSDDEVIAAMEKQFPKTKDRRIR